jgi:hypothetical protein
MGFLDFLFSGGESSQLQKHIKRLNNLNAQQEERLLSAQWLADNGSQEAIAGIMKRFSLTYEKRMKDIEEKEHLYRLLISIGPETVEPTKVWLRRNQNFAIPIRIIEKFDGKNKTVDFLLELLGLEMDPFKPEKKRQLIIKLGDYDDERMIEQVSACLEDYDEGVRLAAIETLHSQNNPKTKEALLETLANPQEESNRLRIRLAEIFQQCNWDLAEKGEILSQNPPVGWVVSNNRLIEE